MLDHLGLRVSDIAKAKAFYETALAPLGIKMIFEVPKEATGGDPAYGFGEAQQPYFWIGKNGPATAGVHVAFTADSRAQVDAFYKAAIAAGGTDNGAPGVRAIYHPDYYGAFVLDADGHNVEAVCHAPE